MKDLVEYIAKNIVSKPETVVVEEIELEPGVIEITLTVDPEDMGMIIGKGGQMIKAIRKLLTVRAMAEQVRVNLQLNDPQGSKLQNEENEAPKVEDKEPEEEKAEEEKE